MGNDNQNGEARGEEVKSKRINDNVTEYFPEFNLEETTDVSQSLLKLYEYIEERTKSSINWYWKAKKWPAFFSRSLRQFAIVLAVLGGLAPLLENFRIIKTDWLPSSSHFGYILLAIAGGLILFDKLFGYSTTWIRFVTAAQNLQKTLAELRMDWTDLCLQCDNQNDNVNSSNKFNPELISKAFQMLKIYLLKVESIIESETLKWVEEFKSSLSDLEKTIGKQQEEARIAIKQEEARLAKQKEDAKLAMQQEEAKLVQKLEESKPGAVDVNVANCDFSKVNDLKISLDDLFSSNLAGAQYSFIGINPGIHKVTVTGLADGKKVAASQATDILPGKINKVTLTL